MKVLDKYKKEYTGNNKLSVDNTDKNKVILISNYIKYFGNITRVCKNSNLSRQTFYEYKKEDKKFAKAIDEADQEILDNVEAMYIQFDLLDKKKYEARKFYLQSRHPKYKPKQEIDVPEGFNINIKMVDSNEQRNISEQKDI